MTLHINLSPEMETFIKGKVASGFYGNATEVIRDAIRRMQADEGRVHAWRSAIKKGDDELDRGEGVPYTPKTLSDSASVSFRPVVSSSSTRADAEPVPAKSKRSAGDNSSRRNR